MVKKLTAKQLQDLIWDECKRIIRIRYDNVCYTCGEENLFGKNFQTGHMIPKAYVDAYLKYDLRILRPQCFSCNIWRGGMGALFIENMREREGNKYVNLILKELDTKIEKKAIYKFYLELLREYVTIKR